MGKDTLLGHVAKLQEALIDGIRSLTGEAQTLPIASYSQAGDQVYLFYSGTPAGSTSHSGLHRPSPHPRRATQIMAQRIEKSLSPQRAAPLPQKAALPQVIPQSISSAPVDGVNEDRGLCA